VWVHSLLVKVLRCWRYGPLAQQRGHIVAELLHYGANTQHDTKRTTPHHTTPHHTTPHHTTPHHTTPHNTSLMQSEWFDAAMGHVGAYACRPASRCPVLAWPARAASALMARRAQVSTDHARHRTQTCCIANIKSEPWRREGE
jgi:hypothetical protein